MFLLIDNYDSFTYNLAQAFQILGAKPVVVKNDDPQLLDLADSQNLEMVCISPGPGSPDRAGLAPAFLKKLDKNVPVLGVCLGHQLLAAHAGAHIRVAPTIMHGKQSEIFHNGETIFKDLPNPLTVGRYHSLVATTTPESEKQFNVTARGPEGEIMALEYNDRPWIGVQFHPESVLTPAGARVLENFLARRPAASSQRPSIGVILDTVAKGDDLTADMAAAGFDLLMDGELTPAQAGAFLMGLRMKGESALELAHATRSALARSVRVPGLAGDCIDVVGTGGDGRNSFNCSTATSLTLAGMGYRVVKHGNRAVSSKSGSADALEALGIPIDSTPESALKMLDKLNFTFLFAPNFHPAFKNIGPLRRELGLRTLFNILGPMINPARPNHLLMGVARPELVELIANTLAQAPLHRAAVVCGAGDYDELTPIGPTDVAILHEGRISREHIDPARYGFPSCRPEDLAVRDKEHAAQVLRELLSGGGPKHMQDMLILNTGLAIHLLEEELEFDEAMEMAAAAVHSGAAGQVLANA